MMRNTRKLAPAVATGGALALVAACSGSAGGGAGDTTVLRIGHMAIEDSSYENTLQAMSDELEESTEGRVTIETYPNAQLGGELEHIEQIQSRAIEGAVLTTGSLSSMIPEFGAMSLPYLFDGPEHARDALAGELGEHLNGLMPDAGLVGISFWEMGYKNVTNSSHPITTASDMEGLQIRVLEDQILLDIYSALGAEPTPLPWTETYTALQQGVVDGYEGPYEAMVSAGLHEVQPYITELEMIYGGVVLTLGQDVLDGLSEEDQQAVRDVGAEWSEDQRELNQENLDRFKQEALDYGVEIVELEDVDQDSFREATAPVIENATEFEEIVELADAAR